MVTIRRFNSLSGAAATAAVKRVQEILHTALPGVSDSEIEVVPARILGLKKSPFNSHLFLAEESCGVYAGFALLLHDPALGFCLLDYIATDPSNRSHGVGSMLYEAVRSEARNLAPWGLYYECSPDESTEVSDPSLLPDNVARMRFYERWGARPIVNNQYQLPNTPGQKDLPYLVYDPLEGTPPPGRSQIRAIVRAILVGKYRSICSPQYIEQVVSSFQDSEIKLRPYRYNSVSGSSNCSSGISG